MGIGISRGTNIDQGSIQAEQTPQSTSQRTQDTSQQTQANNQQGLEQDTLERGREPNMGGNRQLIPSNMPVPGKPGPLAMEAPSNDGRVITVRDVRQETDRLERTRNAWIMHMVNGNYGAIPSARQPLTEGWDHDPQQYYMHLTPGDDTQMAFIQTMVDAAEEEGFQLLLSGSPQDFQEFRGSLPREQQQRVRLAGSEANTTVWVEDASYAGRDQVCVPPFIDNMDLVFDAIEHGRRERYDTLYPMLQLDPNFTYQGAIGQAGYQEGAIAQAMSSNTPIRMNLSYMEGGNILTGNRPDGTPYAIVGMDNFAITKALLERDASRLTGENVTFSDNEIRLVMAKDLGVEPEQLILIEQPGDFHIDMSMAITTEGKVMLNDAAQVATFQTGQMKSERQASLPQCPDRAHQEVQRLFQRIETTWQNYANNPEDVSSMDIRRFSNEFRALRRMLPRNLSAAEEAALDHLDGWVQESEHVLRQIKSISANTDNVSKMEDIVAKQLTDAGLGVVRVPGRFHAIQSGELEHGRANFLNGEGGINESGQYFYMTMDADPEYRDMFFQKFNQAFAESPHLHFVPQQAANASLALDGGLSCRVLKTEIE